MDLASLLDERVVKVPLEATEKEEAIAELVELLVRAGRVTDRRGVLQALYERERKGTTGIGGGVAIPHAKHAEVQGALVAAGISGDGIGFGAVDDEDVYLVFLVMAELDNPGPNVAVLAEIGYLMQIPDVYERLTAARTASEFIRTVREVQNEPSTAGSAQS